LTVFKRRPRLKSLMWGGFVARRKRGVRESCKFETWVYGIVNNIGRPTDHARSRFVEVYFQQYSIDQFREMVI